MASLNINIEEGIKAVISGGNKTGLTYTPVILDPVSESYSTFAKLVRYDMFIKNIQGLKDPSLLHNGRNSRFTAGGTGTCDIELIVEDEAGNTASHTITITIL